MAAPVRPKQKLTDEIRQLVASASISQIARRLKLADATIARIAGGLPVTEGTALVAAMRLDELGNQGDAPKGEMP